MFVVKLSVCQQYTLFLSLSVSLFIEYLSRVLLKTRDFALCGYMYGVAVFVYCLHVCAHMNNSEIVSNLFVCFSLFCKLFCFFFICFFSAKRNAKTKQITQTTTEIIEQETDAQTANELLLLFFFRQFRNG